MREAVGRNRDPGHRRFPSPGRFYRGFVEGSRLYQVVRPDGGGVAKLNIWELDHAVSDGIFEACLAFTTRRTADNTLRKFFEKAVYDCLERLELRAEGELLPYEFPAPGESEGGDEVTRMLLDKPGNPGTAMTKAVDLFLLEFASHGAMRSLPRHKRRPSTAFRPDQRDGHAPALGFTLPQRLAHGLAQLAEGGLEGVVAPLGLEVGPWGDEVRRHPERIRLARVAFHAHPRLVDAQVLPEPIDGLGDRRLVLGQAVATAEDDLDAHGLLWLWVRGPRRRPPGHARQATRKYQTTPPILRP